MASNPYVNKVQLADGTSLIDISDTTATADKILQGYTAYGSDGQKLTGTATGGGGSVTQDQDGFIVLPPDGGGGSASKIVSGTFTASSTTGAAQAINIPYSGSGYPISCFIYPTYGMGHSSVSGLIQQYVIPLFYINKTYLGSSVDVPTYATTGVRNQAHVVLRYKNTNDSATSYGTGAAADANTFSSDSATDSSRNYVVRFTSNTTLSVFIASSSYGLIPNVKYTYMIEYSE